MQANTSRTGRDEHYYFRVWMITTATAAGIFLVPFVLFCAITNVESQALRLILEWGIPCALLGLAMAAIAAFYAVRFLKRTTDELAKALDIAHIRESERDVAQQELVRKLMEERELEREKMQFEAQLAEYEKYATLAQLSLGAAHEINNPLLGILSHLELELKEATSDDARIEIQQCIEGTKRISHTIRGLLNYTRPGPLLLTKINLDRIVNDTLGFLSHQPMFRNIRLEKRILADLPDFNADANQLSQILMNLLLNAAEAASDGGSITVSAKKADKTDTVEISIADTGCGIPPDILPHVFEPFFTTKHGKGTGLGLSISQSYVRTHGGEISISSTPSQGTTVRFTLPVARESVILREDGDEVVV
ncbi:MAG TPA: ATP-binding protein [Terriglobales bacterium]|nr:ATP-binding protein [Terriglobales bacterium]